MSAKKTMPRWNYPSCIRLGVYQFRATIRRGPKRPVTLWQCEHIHQTQNDAMTCATREYFMKEKTIEQETNK